MLTRLLGLPPEGSAHAAAIDRVIGLEHVGMALLFVACLAYFVFVLVRFRRASQVRARYAGVHAPWSYGIAAALAVCELLLLFLFELPMWRDRVDGLPAPEQSTVVRVVAEQFAWNIHYPGADRRFGRTDIALVAPDNPLGLDRTDPSAMDDITTINQLVVPGGRPVLVHLSSKDVIHSFTLYEMRVKQDALPGTETLTWFVPTVTTAQMRERLGRPAFDYEIACSQLCGLGHYRMRGVLTVTTDAAYQDFLATELQRSRGAVPPTQPRRR